MNEYLKYFLILVLGAIGGPILGPYLKKLWYWIIGKK